ncbi:MAG TPA: GT4 family glycosyltransferase PelF [Spirochaetia bacterium]|nr:GT4 family glycosyltransferase PelF [Spirochaetia bacterium]
MADASRAAGSTPLTVCLLLEGSYPYITGGVSGWVQELIQALPDVRFSLLTISPRAGLVKRYTLPQNVVAHRDVVLTERHASRGGPTGGSPAFLEAVRLLHAGFASASAPDLEAVLSHMPVGYFPYTDAVREPAAWDMIVSSYQEHNPVYPFSEYFWSWKSSHDMVFRALGEETPPADLYHAVCTGYAGITAVAAKLRTGRPFVLTEHGLYHKEREMEIKRAQFVKGYQRDLWISMYAGISRLCYRHADLIVSLFEQNRRRQIALGAEEDKAIVIPNGIDIPRYSAVVREKREGFHVGLVGRVVPIKDIKTFILMAQIVAAAIPEARFWCIGPMDEDAAYSEECEALVRSLLLSDRFTFTGKTDVSAYYSFLDVLVLTSVREAQPLVILEAFAVGLPVVSTRVGNVPELLDYQDRFLASPRDAGALAQAVKGIHDRPEDVAELAAKNRQKVHRFYDKSRVFGQYGEIYRRLAAGGGPWRA